MKKLMQHYRAPTPRERVFLRGFFSLLAGISLALIVITCSWSLGAYTKLNGLLLPNGLLAGGDYLALYCGGRLYSENTAALYNYELQYECEVELAGSEPSRFVFLPFIYPPLAAAALSLLSHFSYLTSYTVWAGLSFLFAAISLLLLLRKSSLPGCESSMLFLAFLGFHPFLVECLLGGQTSAFGLFLLTAVYLLLKQGCNFTAGAVFSLSYYKPPLFFLLLLFLAYDKGRRFVAGFAAAGTLLLLCSLAAVGFDGLRDFISQASSYTYGSTFLPDYLFMPRKAAGIYALLVMLIPESVLMARLLFVLLSAALLYAAYYSGVFRRNLMEEDQDLAFALQLVLSLCLSLQMIIYDLTLLALPIILFCSDVYRRGLSRQAVPVLLCILFLFLEFVFRDTNFGPIRLNAAAPLHLLFLISLLVYARARFRLA